MVEAPMPEKRRVAQTSLGRRQLPKSGLMLRVIKLQGGKEIIEEVSAQKIKKGDTVLVQREHVKGFDQKAIHRALLASDKKYRIAYRALHSFSPTDPERHTSLLRYN